MGIDTMDRIKHGGLCGAENDWDCLTKMNKLSCFNNCKMVDFELLKLGCTYRFNWSMIYVDITT